MYDPPHHVAEGGDWTTWIPVLLIGLLIGAYLFLVYASRAAEERRQTQTLRALSFITGMLLIGIAMLPGVMQDAHADLRIHMVQHLLIAMFAPILLVLAAPVTLTLQVLPVRAARRVTAVLKSRAFTFVSHPFMAMMLNTGGMFVLYLTPLYGESLVNPYLHYVVHIHFLLAGYLFVWSIIGTDPVPQRPDHRLRVFILFLSIGLHAFLSKFMYAYRYPLNTHHSGDQIREATKLMYYWGDFSELILVIIVFYQWYTKKIVNCMQKC